MNTQTLIKSAIALFISTGMASALTINFDTLAPTSYTARPVTNGYDGFNWNNFYYEEGRANTGFGNGLVSGHNVGLDGSGLAASFSDPNGVFNLDSVYVTSAWLTGMTVTVDGYTPGNSNPAFQKTFMVNESGPTFETFNFDGIDEVTFSTGGGTAALVGGSTAKNFVVDNIGVDFNPISVPDASSTVWLMGAPWALLD